MTRGKRILLLFAVLAVVVAVAALFSENGTSAEPDLPPLTESEFLMNTVVDYQLYGPHAQQAHDAIAKVLRDVESKTSMFLADSEISLLNERAGSGVWTVLSPMTFDLLSRTAEYCAQSAGVFDVTIAPLTKLWDVTSVNPKIPDASEVARLRAFVDYRGIELDAKTCSARLTRMGQAVDIGGIAKGYACDLTRKAALDAGLTAGYISIGGNLMVIGEKPDGKPFRFGVRDPRGGNADYIAVVELPDSTMATSGDYERYFEQDGVRYHHILDPATGWPVQSDLISVSVVAPDGAYADYLSTYLFIRGKEFALQNLNKLNCGLIVIDREKNVYRSDSLKNSFTPADQSGSYHFVY